MKYSTRKNLEYKVSKSTFLCKLWAFVRTVRKTENAKLDESIATFVKDDRKSDRKYVAGLKLDMNYAKLHNRIEFDEYFLMNFEMLTEEGRRKYIGDIERKDIFGKLASDETKHLFDNKYLAYTRLKDFYKREMILIKGEDDREKFNLFLKNHNTAVIKPIADAFGHGVKIFNIQESDFDVNSLFEKTVLEGEHVVEELIVQSGEMAVFHPQSCNTIRFATYIKNGEVTPLFAFLRMGMGSSVVDNAGSGGVFASIDIDTGIIKTPGITEYGVKHLVHPDTGVVIIGHKIPRWDELVSTVKSVARAVPEQPYVGWDMALTDSGWIVVEGNYRGQLVHQYAEGAGCREAINIVMEDYYSKL